MTDRMKSWLVATLVVAGCGGGEPPATASVDARVPPPDAGPVEIVGVSLDVGDRVIVGVDGTKPTPCHEVGWIASGDGTGEITIWSEPPPPDTVCAQVIEPFSIEIDLGPLEAGTEVVVNGEVIGTVG